MHRAGLIVAMVLSGAVSALPGRAEAKTPAQPEAKRVELENGLRLLVIEQPQLPMVVLNATIDAGSRFDPRGKEGLAGLTSTLLTEGTKSRSAAEIHEATDFLGARLSAGSGDDYATLSLTVLGKDLEAGLDLFADVLRHPAFAKAEFDRKRDETLASLEAEDQSPSSIAEREFRRALFGDGPYRAGPGGWKDSVGSLRVEEVRTFYRQAYRPDRIILVASGDVTLDQMRKLLEARFGDWKTKAPEPKPPEPQLNEGPKVLRFERELTQANLVWGHGGTTRDNPDWYAISVMNYILGGGGFSSRMMNSIRVEGGLAYSVFSFFRPGKVPGSFQVGLQTKSASTGEAIRLIEKEIERIRTNAVNEDELVAAKKFLTGSFPLKFDSNGEMVVFYSQVEFYGLGLDYASRYVGLINSITSEDVQRVAKRYLEPEKAILVVVGKQAEIQLPTAASP